MSEDKHIKDIFRDIEEDILFDLEEKVMQKIDRETDHSLIIKRYQKFSKIGMWTTLALVSTLILLYLIPIFSGADPNQFSYFENSLSSVFCILTLLLLYFQIEIYKSARIPSMKNNMQHYQ